MVFMLNLEVLILFFGLLILLIGSLTDIERREIPDWISLGSVFFGLLVSIIRAIVYSDFWFIIFSILGIISMFFVGAALYYTNQWGGGDAKVLMGFGALFGSYVYAPLSGFSFIELWISQFPFSHHQPFYFLVLFFVHILLFGALYSLLWTITRIARKWSTFSETFMRTRKSFLHFRKLQILSFVLLTIGIILLSRARYFGLHSLTFSLIGLGMGLLGLAITLLSFSYIFSKAAESTFLRDFSLSELTPGEWIVEDIYYKGKYICGPKDLGITQEQIEILKKTNITHVKVKVGIPFLPAFLIAYVFVIFGGNLFLVIQFFIFG
jgi:prepilin signal peptidase PulO-like enzyme (type II secretory pathway)